MGVYRCSRLGIAFSFGGLFDAFSFGFFHVGNDVYLDWEIFRVDDRAPGLLHRFPFSCRTRNSSMQQNRQEAGNDSVNKEIILEAGIVKIFLYQCRKNKDK